MLAAFTLLETPYILFSFQPKLHCSTIDSISISPKKNPANNNFISRAIRKKPSIDLHVAKPRFGALALTHRYRPEEI